MERLVYYLQQKMQQLYPLQDPTKQLHCFIKKQIIRGILYCLGGILFGFAIFFSGRQKELYNQNTIVRPKYGEADKQVTLQVKPKDSSIREEQVTFEVAPKEYNYREFKKEVKKVKKYINKTILKDNKAFEKVKSDLFFPEKVENSFLQLQWSTDNEEVVSSTGQVNNFNIKNRKIVTITVTFLYKKYETAYLLPVYVYPKDLSPKENFFYKLKHIIQLQEKKRTSNELFLPSQIDGEKIIYSEPKQSNKIYILIPVVIILLIFASAKGELERGEKKRIRQLKIEYPEIMNQIAILLSAGLTIRGVFGKITNQYEQRKINGKRNYSYEEIAVAYYEMQNGLSEVEALERMGARIQIMSYRKLMTLLSQNGKKGSKDLINQLEIETYDAYEERKELVRALGEEAGIKLLIPMLMMLLIVLTVIIAPVCMTF